MYSFLQGFVDEIIDNELILNVNNIGYSIFIPKSIISELPDKNTEVRLYTYFVVREDANVLYGFLTKEDRELFKKMLTVNSLGPKGALSILSVMSSNELMLAIMNNDDESISKAPGIGKKTAQKLILELKDKLDFEEAILNISSKKLSPSLIAAKEDAIAALTALGYTEKEVKKAISDMDLTDDMTSESILKKALIALSF
ncbi:MAG: Holliday junction branch migration protein RuvA [Lachnospiraceae bacterium]|nr:Holliday junction branch migration protein RuvA [Lachnospiraceae bacterium]